MRKFIQRFSPFLLIFCCVILILWLIPLGYSQEWTGFGIATFPNAPDEELRQPKRLWDWLELLVIPLVLAISAAFFSQSERRNEQKIADQRIEEERRVANQRIDEDRRIADQRIEEERKIADDRAQDAALQAYLEQMSVFLIDKELRHSEEGSEVRDLARAWTLTFLRRLNGDRKGVLLRFLFESELINEDKRIISLSQADLSGARLGRAHLAGADLSQADLSRADLSRADLSEATLFVTNLSRANLRGAILAGADLRGAILAGADLRQADLSGATLFIATLAGADLRGADLRQANLNIAELSHATRGHVAPGQANLSRTKYNVKTKWPDGFKPESHGAILID